MTFIEVNSLLEKVKMYRPFYEGSLGKESFIKLKQDWYKALEKYSFNDVEEKIEEFFKNDNTNTKVPTPYQLRDDLIPEEIKEKQSKYKLTCMFCGRWLDGNEIQKHERRCRSVKYLSSLCLRYFKRDIGNKPELYDMSDELFNKNYIIVLEKILNYVGENERKGIENVINSYYGRETAYSINEL